MQLALAQAKKAALEEEVPVGVVLVAASGKIVASAYNRTIARSDPTAHAEILALRKAGRRIRNNRLLNMTLYVTVEPCPMCMGAIIHARIALLVFGAFDPKGGAVGSLYDFAADPRFNHHPQVINGICKREARALMQEFFRKRRIK